MALQDLALPIDIPWKRLGASIDMMDTAFGAGPFPPKWRSSLAFFYDEPTDAPDGYCDRVITYLKVVCTVTGYQLDQKEVDLEYDPSGQTFAGVPIVIRARGTQVDNAWSHMALLLNQQTIREWDVVSEAGTYGTYVTRADLTRGQNQLAVAFTNGPPSGTGGRQLFVDSVAVGPQLLHATDAGVTYEVWDGNGNYVNSVPGQRELDVQGQLVFPFDYSPEDWMAQLVGEYDNIGAYLPCYGALLQVAVFPSSKKKQVTTHTTVSFAQMPASHDLANPYQVGDVRLAVLPAENKNVIGDPAGYPRSLDLQKQLTLTLPATPLFDARVAAIGGAVTVEAYSGNNLVGSQKLQAQPNQVQGVTLQGANIDRVVFTVDKAGFLAEFGYDVVSSQDVGLADYPYVMAIEPDKRELYEAVTETGDMLSRSSSDVNVRKGVTGTNSTEDQSILKGAQGKLAVSLGGGAGVEAGGGVQGEWGTTSRQGTEDVNIRSIDNSREKRESFSHSTNLTQMYHQLNGYHLGTNRSVFFLLPRPHITELTENGLPARTFVKGPQRLEGIQEFFLIVNRPKGVPGICVHGLLETAHLDWEVTESTENPPQPPPPTPHQLEVYLTNKYREKVVPYYHTGDHELYHWIILSYFYDGQDFNAIACRQEKHSVAYDPNTDNYLKKYYADALAEYLLDNPPPEVPPPKQNVTTTTTMIVTARDLYACLPNSTDKKGAEASLPNSLADSAEWVSLESHVPTTLLSAQPAQKARAANHLVQTIGKEMLASHGSRKRYPDGKINFLKTQFVLDRLRQRIMAMPEKAPQNKPVADLDQIPQKLRDALAAAFPNLKTRKQVLSLSLSQLAKGLKLADADARDLQLRLLGLVPRNAAPANPG
jgi:hypothetical protein